MAVRFTYRPPVVSPAVLIHAAVEGAADAAASALLDASQPLVPVEDGVLKASGRTVRDGHGVAVTYGRDDDGSDKHAASNVYGVIVHEDLTANHPNGGTAKFLETPMHSAREAIMVAAAVEMKRAFG